MTIKSSRWLGLVFVALSALASVHRLEAQKERIKLQPYADLKPYYLGFNVGIHTQDLRIHNSGFVTPDGQALFADVPAYRPGFTVGVIGGKVFAPGIELRINPSLHFGEKPIAYGDGRELLQEFNLRSTYLSIPLQLKYCAYRLNNVRPYVGVGLYTAFSLGERKEALVRFRTLDYGVVASVGCDIYMRYFKLSPELSFSYGLVNAVQTDRPEFAEDKRRYYTEAMISGHNRMIALTFYFQ